MPTPPSLRLPPRKWRQIAAALWHGPRVVDDQSIEKCTGGESNPYALRRRNLNPLRLPVSPPVRCV